LLWLLGAAAVASSLHGVGPSPAPVLVGVASVLALATALAVTSQRCGLFARPVHRVATSAHEIALTFDDGPDPRTTPQVLDLLREHRQRATFFVIGERAARHPDLLRRIAAEGHEIANHSLRHRWHLLFWPPRRLAAELLATQRAVVAAGVPAPRLWRPPIGLLSPRLSRAAELARLTLIGYSARAYDRAPHASARGGLARLRRKLLPGAILLLHDTPGSAGPLLLADLLDELARRELTSRPLSELLQ
jgi:peptidoglycan/xylan/chitin deacetylase (PgdA/CDA1 family)